MSATMPPSGLQGNCRQQRRAMNAAIKPSVRDRMTGGHLAARGFTLIEVVLATLLLALGLAIAFASLHSANGSVQRAERAAARSEHLRAVQEFLYRTLQSAQPLVLERDADNQQTRFFEGKRDQIRFVAPMPGYLSRGGPYVLTLKLVPSTNPGVQRLQFSYAMLVNEQPLEEDAKQPAEDLLDGIVEGSFEYRALDSETTVGAWTTQWDRPAEMPLEIRLRLRLADPAQVWPVFVAALPLGFDHATAGNANGAANAPGGVP